MSGLEDKAEINAQAASQLNEDGTFNWDALEEDVQRSGKSGVVLRGLPPALLDLNRRIAVIEASSGPNKGN